MMVVDELVRISWNSEVAGEWAIESDDHEKHHGNEPGKTDKQKVLQTPVLHVEKEKWDKDGHGSGQQHYPHHTGQTSLYRVQALASVLHQLVEHPERFSMDDFLRVGCRLERKEPRLKAVHPFHAFVRNLPAFLQRPSVMDNLLGVAAQHVAHFIALLLRIATEIAPQSHNCGRLAGHDLRYFRVLLPHANRRERRDQGVKQHG